MKKNKDNNIFFTEGKIKDKKVIFSISKTTRQEKKEFLITLGIIVVIVIFMRVVF